MPQPEFFTRKQLTSLLFKNGNISPEASELADFTKEFYTALSNANADVKTNERAIENRRLDAFSRLIVGDEVCAATAFDGEKLYISTNNNDHVNDVVKIESQWTLKKGSTIRSRVIFEVDIYITYQGVSTKYKIKEPVVYQFNKNTSYLHLNKDIGKVRIEAHEHMMPNVPYIDLVLELYDTLLPQLFCTDFKPIHLNKNLNDPSLVTEDMVSERELMFNTSFSPFKRSAEHLVEHLSLIALLAFNEEESSFLNNAKRAIRTYRESFLKQSFSWEAAKWFRGVKQRPDKRFGDTYISELKTLIEKINVDFSNFETLNLDDDESLTKSVRLWSGHIIEKIKTGQIIAPYFIKNNPDILSRIWRYYVDLIKLEQYVSHDAKTSGKFATALSKEAPLKDKKILVIVDDLAQNVHAEMRLLYRAIKNDLNIDYIATSKRCCAHCALVMHNCRVVNISGIHGNAYGKWCLSPEFLLPKFIEKILGKNLAQKLEVLSKSSLSFNGKLYNQKDLAVTIIQSIAALDEALDYPLLQIDKPKLYVQKDELACESDDEEEQPKTWEQKQGLNGLLLNLKAAL